MTLEILKASFTVAKVSEYSEELLSAPFCFIGKTDRERSVLCPTPLVPATARMREDGWRGVRIAGALDFGLVGILARISAVCEAEGIPIFAVSTFDTDYIFCQEAFFQKALTAWQAAGWCISGAESGDECVE